jgi:hypothetical protein
LSPETKIDNEIQYLLPSAILNEKRRLAYLRFDPRAWRKLCLWLASRWAESADDFSRVKMRPQSGDSQTV